MTVFYLFRGGNIVIVSSVGGYQPMQVSGSIWNAVIKFDSDVYYHTDHTSTIMSNKPLLASKHSL